MISIISGRPGSGKSLKTAQITQKLLIRNKKWFKKTGNVRQVYSNIKFNEQIENQFKGFLSYWETPEELVKLRDCDIIWDEVATHLDSTQWQNLPLEVKRFLQQHRKRGIDIYGNTQDFAMVDISMRRLVSVVSVLRKVVGSPDISPTRPAVRNPWGIIFIRDISPDSFEKEKKEYIGWSLLFITKELCQFYDTTQEIKAGSYPPLKHIERTCIDPDCAYHKVVHV